MTFYDNHGAVLPMQQSQLSIFIDIDRGNMAHFVIAGKADDIEFAKAEVLAHRLLTNLPDFHADFILKHPREWDAFVEATVTQNHWTHRLARDRTLKTPKNLPQLIWRESGELIGNTKDFLDLMKATYDQDLDVNDIELRRIAEENMSELLAHTAK
ncbi:uncharacterized protein EV422DRAFT_537543 [Fimicolochytrium jonesii]|uniref:uncharacterized protein n=1 Tax=Fimicolochytrium jonesii TaxID=1396493 RepID=UPI0022FEE966|nr:uncharacterized protein EV422DRAFT_537543 [Fimicolochytrium jonesii]KAI8818573.1 hypothetical protein EV422DRAFT_537543 [Fimicolochytrium jonesii]